ncbi:MAG TPA: glycosyltransferase family 4 protein [Actinomycetota bacterium]|nr:glycosyltransferase family 4 protein [Actinomycetota bacterium]
MQRLRILTWHVHGSYLYALAHTGHDFLLPVKPGRPEGYLGRAGTFPWPATVREVAAEDVRRERFDLVLFQSRRNYLVDQFEILSPSQRRLPRVYVEHDPPREHPTDARHPVDDPDVLLVHVTAFNDLMWDSGRTPTRVIEHGVPPSPGVRYLGYVPRGVVVMNEIARRGRRAGLDLFLAASRTVPLDLFGMGSEAVGGHGPVPHDQVAPRIAERRFFFHPARYTSLGLAVCEAMMIGAPVVALATTEIATVVRDGVSGFVHTDPGVLVARMRELLADHGLARRLGEAARRHALERFDLGRFCRRWNRAFADAAGGLAPGASLTAGRVR